MKPIVACAKHETWLDGKYKLLATRLYLFTGDCKAAHDQAAMDPGARNQDSKERRYWIIKILEMHS